MSKDHVNKTHGVLSNWVILLEEFLKKTLTKGEVVGTSSPTVHNRTFESSLLEI